MSCTHPRLVRGFTLVELGVALAVAAVMAALAWPPMQRWAGERGAAALAASLRDGMALARTSAVMRQRVTLACPSRDGRSCRPGSDWSWGWIIFADTNGNQQHDDGEPLLQVERLANARRWRLASNLGRRYLRYLPDGRSAGSNLSWVLCADGKPLQRWVVSNSGRLREDSTVAGVRCPVAVPAE